MKLKTFLKDTYQSFKYFFLKDNRIKKNKYNLDKNQIYPAGKFLIESLDNYSHQILKSINFKLSSKNTCIGTCFAEEFSNYLKNKTNYKIFEQNRFNFQANWGRVYTVKNMRQLVDYSFNENYKIFTKEGMDGFFDPLRDYTCGSYSSEKELVDKIKTHRNISKKILSESEFLFLTLGQTEGWIDKYENFLWGATPTKMINFYENKSNYELKNFTYDEINDDLNYVIENLKKNNKALKIILTLSPVPSSATFFKKNAILSSSEGKAKLRIAIKNVENNFEDVKYFPSFENVIYDNKNYNSDNRHVKLKKIFQIFNFFDKYF